jgi:hypothetical protein
MSVLLILLFSGLAFAQLL